MNSLLRFESTIKSEVTKRNYKRSLDLFKKYIDAKDYDSILSIPNGKIQYLIDNHIITVSETSSGYGSSQEIPNWVKNNACWWSQDLITGEDFASGIEYLIQKGIIRV